MSGRPRDFRRSGRVSYNAGGAATGCVKHGYPGYQDTRLRAATVSSYRQGRVT